MLLAGLLLLLQVLRVTSHLPGRWRDGHHDFSEEKPYHVNITRKHIDQPLDHFNDKDTRTWNMTYYERLDYWKPGGPLLILFHEPDQQMISSKHFIYPDIAKEVSGALFLAEQRYSFISEIPNENMTSYEFFTTQQQMADIIVLIELLKSDQRFEQSKILLMGISNTGRPAVWLRQARPDLIHAVYASSAPLLAQIEYDGFFTVYGNMLKRYGPPGCYEATEKYFRDLDENMKTKEGRATIRKQLNVCDETDLDIVENQEYLLSSLVGLHTSEIGVRTYSVENTIKLYCANYWNLTTATDYCLNFDFYQILKIMIDQKFCLAMTDMYPGCREFGTFDVARSVKNQPFGERLTRDLAVKTCKAYFGIDADDIAANVAETNRVYGGLSPNVTRALFVTGELDPYIGLTVTKDLSPDAIALVIKGAQAHDELFVDCFSEPDSPEVKEARKLMVKTLKGWLEQ